MSQLSFTPHDLHIDEAGLCFNSKAPSPINTKKHTYNNTCRHTYTMSSASKPRQKQSGKSATSTHLNVKEHTWRANRALTKGIVLSTSCLMVCMSPPRVFDAGFVTKWMGPVLVFAKLVTINWSSLQALLACFYLLAGLLYGNLLSCRLTTVYCANMEIESTAATVVNRGIPAHEQEIKI